MPLTIIDFIEQVDGVTVEDIPPETRERINGALADVTGGEPVTLRITNQGAQPIEITEIDFEDRVALTPGAQIGIGNTFETTTSVPESVETVTIKARPADGGAQGTGDVSTSFTSISVTRDIPEDRVLEISILGGS